VGGETPLGRPKRAREDDIKIELRRNKTGGRGADWIHLARDRCKCQAVVNTVMNIRVL
jgi:hypothetical protein